MICPNNFAKEVARASGRKMPDVSDELIKNGFDSVKNGDEIKRINTQKFSSNKVENDNLNSLHISSDEMLQMAAKAGEYEKVFKKEATPKEIKSQGLNLGRDGVVSDIEARNLAKNISLNKDIAIQLQPKADLLKLVKDFSNVIKTPIFESKISIDKLLNHLADKTDANKRLEYLNLIKPTLENPLFITRENNRYRFVKTFIDSDKITKFLSVIENDKGEFIGITATPIKNTDLKNLLKGDIIWGGDTLSTLSTPQIAKQEVEAISETISNQSIKQAENLAQYRKDIEAKYNIRPIKEFGANYAEFYHDGQNAIKKLLVERQGQVAGAFERKELGDIDLVWGEFKVVKGKIKGYGLSKIEAKHLNDFESFKGDTPQEKLINGISEIIQKGVLDSKNGVDTIIYEKGNSEFRVGLSKGWNNQGDNRWIITAYNNKKVSSESIETSYHDTFTAKEPLANQRPNSTTTANKSQEVNIRPIKEFGANYAEFYHDGQNAIKKLLVERQGQVAGAFERKELGDIDLVWGEVTDAIKHKGYGLSHILDKRMAEFMEQGLSKEQAEVKAKELINKLPDIIKNGEVRDLGNGKVRIVTENYSVGMKKEWKGQEKNPYILTAFENTKESAKNLHSNTFTKGETLPLNSKPNSTPKEIKSQEPTTQPMMNGFSTMAMQKAILHLGSGGMGGAMNANAEQDPDKKAEAFVKGFLLGAGGSVGAMKMLENSAKLAPQLARTSQRLAKDLPKILNDRPDIVGKVLGKTPKDNYNYIFGGENAIGANKAKLKTAGEMARNGADESEIWAKTGWYKDIDKKWKFEINPKGGELKENAISNHITKVKSIEKEISELEKIKDGWGNIEQRIEAGNKINELKKQKDKLQVNVGDILDDKMLFTSYPELKNIQVVFNNYDGGASYGGKIELSRALEPTMMKSVLYHELQHEIQIIERFANGGGYFADKTEVEELLKKYPNDADLKKLYDGLENDYIYEDAEFNVYNKLAGEAEARNVQTRLTANSKEHPNKTLDINPNDRIVKYDSYMSASMELEKDLLTSQGRVNTNALLKNASKMPKPLSRDEFEAQFNANISGDSYVKTPIGDIKVNVKKAWEHFNKNTYNQDRSDLSGAFIHTLQDPLFIVKQNWKPTASPHTMGQSIAKSQNAKRLMDDRQQEIITQSTIFFKPFSDENGGKYLASFAIDKNGELIQKTFYDIDSLEKIKKMIRTPENNVLYYKNGRNLNETMNFKNPNLNRLGKVPKNILKGVDGKEYPNTIAGRWEKRVDEAFDWAYKNIYAKGVKGGIEVVGSISRAFGSQESGEKIQRGLEKAFALQDEIGALSRLKSAYHRNNQVARMEAMKIYESLVKLKIDERVALFRMLDGQEVEPNLAEKLRPTYQKLRDKIDERAEQLISLGMLKGENAKENYIKYSYSQYYDKKDGSFGGFGIGKLRARDENLSYEDRVKLGLIEDAAIAVTQTLNSQNNQIQKAILFKNLANEYAVEEPKDGYVKVSDESVGGGVKKYGALAGKYVPSVVYDDLQNAGLVSSIFDVIRPYTNVIDHIKVNLTVKNPATHGYNVLSNSVLAFLHGDLGANLKLMKLLATNKNSFDELLAKAEAMGLDTASDDIEMRNLLMANDEVAKEAIKTKNPLGYYIGKAWQNLYLTKNSTTGRVARSAYAWEDKWFKLARFKKNLDMGMSDEAAFSDANSAYVDYSSHFNPALKVLDKTGVLPFFHFAVKSSIVVTKAAIKNPAKFAMLQTALIGSGASSLPYWFDSEQKDADNSRLPDWASSNYLPNLFGVKNQVQIGESGLYFNAARAMAGFRLSSIDDITGGGGLIGGLLDILRGRDSWGNDMVGKHDPAIKQLTARLDAFSKQFLPSITLGRYGRQGLAIATGNNPKNAYDEPMGLGELAGRFMGLRMINEKKELRSAAINAKNRYKKAKEKGDDGAMVVALNDFMACKAAASDMGVSLEALMKMKKRDIK
ncbi:PBECR2 nuclease fold domain-containing protein [Campylobacter lanienae]|uniref:putative barnase/colicin E5 family endoribonuclease n=1 Tax=Campylobacter lanienae TaxID=75658 RepID=UPI000BB443CA|nr:PBECR2 nuclease fold domain-containing protein [Campylobacter lanienae]